MQQSAEGLALIKRFEGFRARAYRCPAGIWTIGYGHTAMAGPPTVTRGMVLSEAEAEAILRRDVARFAAGVRRCLARELTDAQFSALVSFAYNVGLGSFRASSVLRAVNAGDFADVPRRMQMWTKADGQVLPGLARRRAAEAAMFSGQAPSASPMTVPDRASRRPRATAAAALASLLSAAAAIVAGPHESWILALLFAAAAAFAGWRILRARKRRPIKEELS
ncbi:MAG: lysozyme [Hyphomicrobiales bacterium]